jgi:cysteine synthase
VVREDITVKLVQALHDVPWGGAAAVADARVRELRTLAGVSTGVTVLASFFLKRKPRGAGGMTRATQQWDKATPVQRKNTILTAWRRANPNWAYHLDHDPYPKGPRTP